MIITLGKSRCVAIISSAMHPTTGEYRQVVTLRGHLGIGTELVLPVGRQVSIGELTLIAERLKRDGVIS